MSIGTLTHATAAGLVYQNREFADGEVWSYLGSGVHRTAFLHHPTDVVYKVPNGGYGSHGANLSEHKVARILRAMADRTPQGFSAPFTALYLTTYGPVVAMENLGSEECYLRGDEAQTARDFFRNNDMHGGNIRKKNGTIYMIDLGHSTPDNFTEEERSRATYV